jgi:hypothetical protein
MTLLFQVALISSFVQRSSSFGHHGTWTTGSSSREAFLGLRDAWGQQQQPRGVMHWKHSTKRDNSLHSATAVVMEADDIQQEKAASNDNDNAVANNAQPHVFATGFSNKMELSDALEEALDTAMKGLPEADEEGSVTSNNIDLAMVIVSSMYDGQSSSSSKPINKVPPYVVERSQACFGRSISHLVGCTTGGIISSSLNWDKTPTSTKSTGKADKDATVNAALPVESEGTVGVSITLIQLPGVSIAVSYCQIVLFTIRSVLPRQYTLYLRLTLFVLFFRCFP